MFSDDEPSFVMVPALDIFVICGVVDVEDVQYKLRLESILIPYVGPYGDSVVYTLTTGGGG